MASNSFLPNGDALLSQWLATFTSVAQANLTTLKLTSSDVQTIVTDTTQFNSGTAAVVAAKNAAKTATQTRATARSKAVKDTRALVKRIQGTPGVSDALKTQLGIAVTSGRRTEVPVFQPTVLHAVLQADLSVRLKWHKNGNTYGTGYVIERQNGPGAAWVTVKTITATHFDDKTCPPGVNATYRVTATRGHLTSMPSAEASIYPKAASASPKAASVPANAVSVTDTPASVTLKLA